jgi:hypothetical protein
MVDTNYLYQVNQKDIMSMFFDKNYETSISSPWKRQMAKMFRNALERKIDLCFSNLILREFIGRAPRTRELLELYQRYFSIIAPKGDLESSFSDLAAATNAIVVEAGEAGDVKDTYSYILAALAHVRYFITEDHDIRRLYAYLIAVRSKGYQAIDSDIKKIRKFFETLSKTSEGDFPIGKILDLLYWGPLPIPVSVLDLNNALSDVLTKTEAILVMFRSLAEIDLMLRRMQESKTETPEEFDGKTCDAAKARIESVAKCIGISTKNLKADMFRVALVEKGSAWSEDPNDKKLADGVGAQLETLQDFLYAEEEEGYDSLEEQYQAEELTKMYSVKCEECGKESEVETEYQGVVEVGQRSMGSEYTHLWTGDANCPFCKNDFHVEYTRWEYPQNWLNYEELEAEGGSIVQQESRDTRQSTLD